MVNHWSFRAKLVTIGLMTGIPLTLLTVLAVWSVSEAEWGTTQGEAEHRRVVAVGALLHHAQAVFVAGDGLLWDADRGLTVERRRVELEAAAKALAADADVLPSDDGKILSALASFAQTDLPKIESETPVDARRAAAQRLRDLGEPALAAAQRASAEARNAEDRAIETQKGAAGRSRMLILLSYLLAMAVSAPLVAFLIRSVMLMIQDVTGCMDNLAQGQVCVAIPHASRRDEIGRMASSIQVFKDNAQELCKMQAMRASQRQDFVVKRDMLALTDALDGEAQFTVGRVAEDAVKVVTVAERMTGASQDMTGRAHAVESDADQATANVDAVAAATEELAASSLEIGRQVTGAHDIASQAVVKAEKASQTIQGMVTAAEEIRQVLSLITDIAAQTNLLALNATIEAARAGDAGKGFAVVANEVKNLANQTAKATDQIAGQLGGISEVSRQAYDAIGEVVSIISQINEAASAIAVAVEEQGAATHHISQNAHEAAERTASVGHGVREIAQGADETGRLAANVTALANDSAAHLGDLQRRLKLILSQTTAMNSSRQGALPVPLPARLFLQTGPAAVDLIDLNQDRALLRPIPPGLALGDRFEMDLPEVGRLNAELEFIDGAGADLKLNGPADAMSRLEAILAGYLALDIPFIAAVKDAANRVGRAFEAQIDKGAATLDDFLDDSYQPIAGSNPAQLMTRFVTVCDRVLPEIQEPMLDVHPGVVFCAAVDRNGFLPTHNRKYSQPQGKDPVWNTPTAAIAGCSTTARGRGPGPTPSPICCKAICATWAAAPM